MFTGYIFQGSQDKNRFESFKINSRSQNDHFRAQNRGFKAISLNKIKHNQLLMQKWMIMDDTMFTGSIF